MYISRTRSILDALDNLGANIFFRLPLYLGHRKTTYVIDDVGIWLLCKPIGLVDRFIRSTTRRLRRRKKVSVKNVKRLEAESGASREDGLHTGDRGNVDKDKYPSSTPPGSSTLEDDKIALRSLSLADRREEDCDEDVETRTYSSNSWSKWSESVIDTTTWLTSISSAFGYGKTTTSRRRRKRKSSRSRGRGRAEDSRGWKRYVFVLRAVVACDLEDDTDMCRRLYTLWERLDAYYD